MIRPRHFLIKKIYYFNFLITNFMTRTNSVIWTPRLLSDLTISYRGNQSRSSNCTFTVKHTVSSDFLLLKSSFSYFLRFYRQQEEQGQDHNPTDRYKYIYKIYNTYSHRSTEYFHQTPKYSATMKSSSYLCTVLGNSPQPQTSYCISCSYLSNPTLHLEHE